MSLLIRSWIALTAVIATVLIVLAVLSVLQHDAVLSQLIRQRLSVTVGTTAGPFRSIVELGLPVSMVRNAQDLLGRARETDPAITAIHLFNPSGIIVNSTIKDYSGRLPREILDAQAEGQDAKWSLETANELISGVSILSDDGSIVGGIVAFYPKRELDQRSATVAWEIGIAALVLLTISSALAFIILRIRLNGTLRALAWLSSLPTILANENSGDSSFSIRSERFGFLRGEFKTLSERLNVAWTRYSEALGRLSRFGIDKTAIAGTSAVVLVSVPETSVDRSFARRMTPLVALLIIGSAVALGVFAYFRIEQSFTPEFMRRTQLIGTVAETTIARTVDAGVPLESLVGGSEFFSHLLKDFPEISYFAIKTGKPLLEVGKRTGGSRSSFPIIIKGREIGQILTEDDPDYLAAQFRNVVLDFGVVVLVIILFAFELIIIMMSASLTGPFDRLLHLVDLQAAGDFSKCLDRKVRNAIERVGALLSERAEELNALFAHALRDIGNRSGSTAVPSELLELAEDFRLRHSRPDILRFCSIRDIRLALFLFTAADQLPLSFFSLYVRSAENPLTWLNPGLVISLPLAGYLLAALVGAALARPIAQRFGHRSEFLIGALLAFVSNLGLFIAGDVISIIIYSALNGLGFALASLACQDYVIDRLPKDERPRKLALVSAALFGGVLAGTALGGVVADRIGQRPVFVVSAFLVLVSAVLIVRFLPHGRIKSPERTEHRTWSLHFLAPLSNLRFAAVTYGIVVPQVIADQVFVSYLLALAMDGLGSSVADIGRVMMVYFLVLIAAGAVYDKLPPRFANPSGVALASSLLSGASLLMAALHPSSWSYLLGAMGAGIGHGLSRGPQSALTVDLAEGALAHVGSNVVLGAVRILERGGSVVGLLTIGFLTSTIGYAGATGAIGLILLAGAAGFAMALVAQAGRIIFQGRNV